MNFNDATLPMLQNGVGGYDDADAISLCCSP